VDKDRNPYNHTVQDSIKYINPDYLIEQIKATTAFAAHLAVPSIERKFYIKVDQDYSQKAIGRMR
jgi:hypothetical protein